MTSTLPNPVPDTSSTSRSTEAPLVLDLGSPPPRPLSFLDQASLWCSLGVSLLIPASALFVLYPVVDAPGMTIAAALTAIVLGSLAGSALLGLCAAPGARTGAPAMALLRGLLGHRTSYLPTVLNLLQCFGWAALEIYVIAETATRLTSSSWRTTWVIAAGLIATFMAVRPLGAVKLVRKYLIWLVLLATIYLFWGVVRDGITAPVGGDWSGFWVAFDVVVALPISWAPLAADYSRHSRTSRAAFSGAFFGYAASCITYFTLGLFAVLAVAGAGDAFTPTAFVGALLAVPAGALALVVLAVDEVDEAFANIYSTAMSTQNLIPRLDRRVLAALIGAVATVAALLVDLESYQSFLFLIGAVFVPLAVTLIVDFYVVRRIALGASGAGYDVVAPGRLRWLMLLPWVVGFSAYNLINPGLVDWWAQRWVSIRDALGFVPPAWLSASVFSGFVAALLTLAIGIPLARTLRTTSVPESTMTS